MSDQQAGIVTASRCPCLFVKHRPNDADDLGAYRYPNRGCVTHQPNYWPRCDERRAACWKHQTDLYYDSFGTSYCPDCDEE